MKGTQKPKAPPKQKNILKYKRIERQITQEA
jgi:ribosomal protein S30